MNKRLFPVVALVAAVTLLIVACGGAPASAPAPTAAPAKPAAAQPAAGQPTTAPAAKPAGPAVNLKFSHHDPATGLLHPVFVNWGNELNKQTNGQVTVKVYDSETLAKGRDVVTAVQTGVADIGWVIVSFFTGQFPLTEAFNLPVQGQGKSSLGAQAMWDWFQSSPDVQKEWSSVKVLGYTCSGPQWIATSKKPVRTVEDVKGLKLRIAGWGGTELLKSVGASPINMAPPEMYDALGKGTLDGIVFDWMGGDGFKMHEVTNYATVFPIVFQSQVVIMNKQKWESLSPDVQKVFTDLSGPALGKAAGEQAFDKADDLYSTRFKNTPGKEIINISAEEQAKWRAAAKPVWDAWVKDVSGKGLPADKALAGVQSSIAKFNK